MQGIFTSKCILLVVATEVKNLEISPGKKKTLRTTEVPRAHSE